MPPERRATRLRSLLEELLSLPAGEREAHLSAACGNDTELLQRARALLDQEEAPAGFLASPLAAPTEQDQLREPRAGERLGPWRLERELGRGGMGTVWLATRDDEAFERRVAIKFLRATGFGRELELRFRRECALQASLEHHAIARLQDSGVSPAGCPYLVLEYVDGVPLDLWTKQARPSLTERLELFLGICDAVSHAHQRLIVHRDLKPGNVLVTSEGEPKLLDFGIAKLVMDEEQPELPELTRAEQRLFTPSYASPEQLRGERVGAASDVYSLGVLLYELLVGRRPLDLSDATWSEALQLVAERTPTAPSQATAGSQGTNGPSARELRGDLDAIVLCALRKEPERRYSSVEAFADDLRRHLAGLPVRARPDALGYRASRFLQRNRLAVAATALVFLALSVGFAATWHQYTEARDARGLAEESLRKERVLSGELTIARNAAVERAEELALLSEDLSEQSERAARRFADVRSFSTELVFDVHRMIVGLPGSLRAQERVLEIGARHLQDLQSEAGDDPALIEELGEAWLRLGDARGIALENNMGKTSEAAENFEHALDLARRLAALEGADPHATASLHVRAAVRVADARRLQGAPDEAELLLTEALVPAAELERSESASWSDLVVSSQPRDRLLDLAMRGRDFDRASEHLSILQRLQQRMESTGQEPEYVRAEGVVVLLRAANLERLRGDHEEMLRIAEQALERIDSMQRPGGPDYLTRNLRIARAKVCVALSALGRPEEAIWLYEQTLSELEAVLRARPDDARARLDHVISEGMLALALEASGQFEDALEPALAARDRAADLLQADPHNEELSQLRADKCLDAARIATRAERPQLAARSLSGALEEHRRRVREHPEWPDRARTTSYTAGILAELLSDGQQDDARWQPVAAGMRAVLEDQLRVGAPDPGPELRARLERARAEFSLP